MNGAQKRELGRYAFETSMPTRVADIVAAEDRSNKLAGTIPALARVLENDRRIRVAYLCKRTAIHVWRRKGEGDHFCGYRCIQIIIEEMQDRTIPEIQKAIENAWDMGYNAHGRVETGGIIGTRKHIGASEAGQNSYMQGVAD